MRSVDAGIDVVLDVALIVDKIFARRSVLLIDLMPGAILIRIRSDQTHTLYGLRRSEIRHVGTQSCREIALDFLHDLARAIDEILAGFKTSNRRRRVAPQQAETTTACGLCCFTISRKR